MLWKLLSEKHGQQKFLREADEAEEDFIKVGGKYEFRGKKAIEEGDSRKNIGS